MNPQLRAFVSAFGVLSIIIMFLLSFAMANQSQKEMPTAKDAALSIVLPMTVLLVPVAFGGYMLFQDMNNEIEIAYVLGAFLICTMWVGFLQIAFSLVRQNKVAN